MDAFDHIAQAAEHMRIAVARFPKDSRGKHFPWIHYYVIAVKIMLKMDELNYRMKGARRTPKTPTPETNEEERI